MASLAHLLTSLPGTKLLRTGDALSHPPEASRWSWSGLRGRIVEITGSGSLTSAFGLVRDAQTEGEIVAWVTPEDNSFFPPDVAETDVDLSVLAIVRVEFKALLRVVDKLSRSGAFGLIVVDFTGRMSGHDHIRGGTLLRFQGLAQKNDIAMVFLTQQRTGSLGIGSLVSLRGEVRRRRDIGDRHIVEVQIVKDKRRPSGWCHTEQCRGPAGLR
jgi:hypothetical protein